MKRITAQLYGRWSLGIPIFAIGVGVIHHWLENMHGIKKWHGFLPTLFQLLSKDSSEYAIFGPNEWIPEHCSVILEGLPNAETVTFDKHGNLYAFVDHGVIQVPSSSVSDKLVPTNAKYIYQASISRPISGMFHPLLEKLFFLDVAVGLLSWDPKTNTIEIASTHAGGQPFHFPDDLDIANDGMIYFSDASVIGPRSIDDSGSMDLMSASQKDMFCMNPTGRIISYNPSTKRSKVIAQGFHFANGVAVAHDQQTLQVSETGKFKISKVFLSNGTVTDFTSKQLPGFPDSIWRGTNGKLWVAIARVLKPSESFLVQSMLARKILSMIPKRMLPQNHYGMFVQVNAETGEIERTFHDTKANLTGFVTSVVEYDAHLYLGSIHLNHIVKCPIP